jgi:endonuclease/exonuclease/phosphatase family metal-dependent hydrolase
MELRRAQLVIATALAAMAIGPLPTPAQAAKGHSGEHHDVTLMTRNLYLGSDLSGVFNAKSLQEVADEAGEIVNDVVANNFPLRAQALAREIRKKRPDLVGLQEVSLFRTGLALDPAPADKVLVDFLEELIRDVNRGLRKKEAGSYRVVTVENEADVEAPANNQPGGYSYGSLSGIDMDARLADRDVVLARVGAGVKTSSAVGGHFQSALVVPIPGGGTFSLTRGFNGIDVNVRGSRFHLVNTHLEAADAAVRQAQAKELVAPGGPATSARPVVLIGDVNSDDDTVQGADRFAYQALLDAGFRERTRPFPFSCCYQTELLTNPHDTLTHQVDHVLTNRGSIRLVRSSVTGLRMSQGFWPSDHAGVVSQLRFK